MAGWNGSHGFGEPVKKEAPSPRRGGGTSHLHGIIGGLAVIVIALVAFWFISSSDPKGPTAEADRETDATPSAVHRTDRGEQDSQSRESRKEVRVRATETSHIEESVVTPKKSVVPERRVITNHITRVKSRYEVFEHPVECELALLACMPAGTMVIGSREYDEDFMQQLEKALDDQIIISPDDPDDVKYYKQSVIEIENQIRDMLKNGEDVVAALTDTRKQLQEFGVYKAQLESDINELQSRNEEMSDEDLELYIKAANMMLKEKGIEPFEFNKLTKTIIKRNPFPNPDYPAEDAGDKEETAPEEEGYYE